MTLLSLVQKFCRRTGIPSPATVYGSTDAQVLQVMNILEEEGNDLAQRHPWTTLQEEATHTTLALEDQGDIETIAPGFRFIRNNTIWDRTDQLPVVGPIDGQEWQGLKAISNTGPRYRYRLRGGHLLSNPAPTAGHTWAFEYQSKNWILDNDGSTTKSEFSEDTDTFLIPDTLLLMGIRWRWLREKGLSYAELFQSYELQVKDAMGRDGGKQNLSMDGVSQDARPSIVINPMSWPL